MNISITFSPPSPLTIVNYQCFCNFENLRKRSQLNNDITFGIPPLTEEEVHSYMYVIWTATKQPDLASQDFDDVRNFNIALSSFVD